MHGFRKHFSTCLSNSDVNELYKKLFMGHSVQLDESYYDKGNEKSRQECLQEYLKAVNLLTLSDENRLKAKLKKEHDEIDNIREQMQTMQESQEQILQFLRDPQYYTLDKQAYCAGPNTVMFKDKALLDKLGIGKDEVLEQVMRDDGTFYGRIAKRQT
jgi:vacuolar-type H+-ATPase subunit I/STV1